MNVIDKRWCTDHVTGASVLTLKWRKAVTKEVKP